MTEKLQVLPVVKNYLRDMVFVAVYRVVETDWQCVEGSIKSIEPKGELSLDPEEEDALAVTLNPDDLKTKFSELQQTGVEFQFWSDVIIGNSYNHDEEEILIFDNFCIINSVDDEEAHHFLLQPETELKMESFLGELDDVKEEKEAEKTMISGSSKGKSEERSKDQQYMRILVDMLEGNLKDEVE